MSCCVDGCETPGAIVRGMCPKHYQRWRHHGDPLITLQAPPGERTACTADGCTRRNAARGLCHAHYRRWQRHGHTGADRPLGKWRPGRHLRGDGYVVVHAPDHPAARKSGYALEHRLVMSDALGRPLKRGETVHHKNGVRDDNRLENLELKAGQHGKHQRVEDLVVWATEVLTRYAPDLLK